MSNWLTADDFAQVAGISSRKARRALSLARSGQVWRGDTLEVRTFHGRGGRSGIQYQVRVSSLPPHLQERLKALQIADKAVLNFRLGDDAARLERAWKHDIIAAALDHPWRSPERKSEIEKLDGTYRLDWTGHRRKLTQSTLYEWIRIYETEGMHGLAQKVRSDKGEKKALINRAWMQTVPFDDIAKETIAEDIVQFIRGLIVKGTTRKLIRFMAAAELRRLTAAYGYVVTDEAEAAKLFNIPDAIVSAEARFKAVYRHNFDRKASEDKKPRIRRTIAGLQPMEIVVMDVHHINVMVRRENGTIASPKFLAFHDVATNRVFGELVFLNERGGVRNVDVIEAFKRMEEAKEAALLKLGEREIAIMFDQATGSAPN